MKQPWMLLPLLIASVLPWNAGWAAEKGPNVVLFLVDDMGWMDSTVYGSQYYETPEMERLAKQAMRFANAYAVPLCSPTRASILTGQYSARHRITSASGHRPPASKGASPYPKAAGPGRPFLYADSKNFLDPSLVTLAEVLKEAGYRTGHFGKWHLGLTAEYRPDHQGFETTWACAPDPGPPSYFSPYEVHTEGTPSGKYHVGNITDGPDGEYITDRLTDEALKFIEAHKNERFYLNLWQYGVHGPWGHKVEYTAEFAKKTDPRGQQRNPIMASMLKSVDESLGRVLNKLDELGLTDNTLFIFYSDNGGNTHSNVPGDPKTMRAEKARNEMIMDWRKWAGPEPPTNNAPLREGKGRIYEGGQRVPLMVRWPGHIQPETVTDAIVGPIDLYPTVLDALQLDRPEGHVVDGVSILPVLTGTGKLQREALFTWFPHLVPAVSVRAGDYKLIYRWEPHPSYPEVRELYNLKTDIGETKNLAASMPEKVAELESLIAGFIKDTGALAPMPNPVYDPQVAAAARAPEAGLVPKMCEVSVADGVLTMRGQTANPFLGTAQVKASGPMKLTLRVRSAQAGQGKILWKTVAQEGFPKTGQSVEFDITGSSDWQDIALDLPVKGKTQIVRIYLPAEKTPVDVDLIEFSDAADGKLVHKWDFDK